MFTKFKQANALTLFLDSSNISTIEYDKTQKVNIILSPALYWVKKISLPVKYAREAKKLLPSIFEDTLPEGKYSYATYKQEEDFFVFAYEDKKIIDLLAQNGINATNISGVYFAQSEIASIQNAIKINEEQALYSKDELLLIAPTTWFSETSSLDLSHIELSKHTVKLQQYGHIVDNGSLYKIGTSLVVLALILIVEIFIAIQKQDTIIEMKDELFSKYKLQSTTMQNESTRAKYEKIHLTQSKLREQISYFLNLKLQSNQKIALLEYKNGTLYVEISGVTKVDEGKILTQLKANKVIAQSSLNETLMKVEVKI